MIGETPVYLIDYDSLIIAKKASNRPKDLIDIEELSKTNNDKGDLNKNHLNDRNALNNI